MTKKEALPEYHVAQSLMELETVKAFVEGGEEEEELVSTLEWFVQQKGAGIADTVFELEGRVQNGKDMKKHINTRQKTYEARLKRLKELVIDVMTELGLSTFEAGAFGTVHLLDNPQPSMKVDEDVLSDAYFTTEIIPAQKIRKLNKNKLMSDLLAGKTVEGASIHRGKHLRFPSRPKSDSE